jgi:hypothetical protein
VIKNLIENSYNEIFNKLHEITEGNVIIGGSISLLILGIIDRKCDDLDIMLTSDDWIKYKTSLESNFRIIPTLQIKYKELDYDVYTCFDKVTKMNEFHLFVNKGQEIYLNFNGFRVFNPKIHLIDKEMIAESGQESEKHIQDIEHIKKYLNEN